MSTKNSSEQKHKSAGKIILLILTILFLLMGLIIFSWYGLTYISVRQTSEIRENKVTISSGGQQCTLLIPHGTLSLRHPSRTAVGSNYKFDAEVKLEEPLRFVDCSGGIPNWTINLEAQTTLISSQVKPYSSIRVPAFDQDQFFFNWTFTPEEEVSQYQSHFWLRAVITQHNETIESWNMLVRDFPMENKALFGQPTILWLIGGGFSLVLGILLLILLLQKRQKH